MKFRNKHDNLIYTFKYIDGEIKFTVTNGRNWSVADQQYSRDIIYGRVKDFIPVSIRHYYEKVSG